MVALIIDDDESVLELVTLMLGELGWDSLTARNGVEALRIVESTSLDLVITDIVMPDMEGIELLKKLRQRQPPIPAVAMSGNPMGTRFLKVVKMLGARSTLMKPFSNAELEMAMNRALPGYTGDRATD